MAGDSGVGWDYGRQNNCIKQIRTKVIKSICDITWHYLQLFKMKILF